MRQRHPVQNLYSSQLADIVPAIWTTWNRLDEFTINVFWAPTTNTWWIFLDFEDPTKRDLIFFHSRTGNELKYYRMNRDLLGIWANNVNHNKSASVRMNDIAEWMNYISQNVEDFWYIQQWWNWNNAIKVAWWKLTFWLWTFTAVDTVISALVDGTREVVFDYTDWLIKTITTANLWNLTWLRLWTVVVASASITSITDTRAIAQPPSFNGLYFDTNTGQVELANSWVVPGTYWDSLNVPVVTVDAKGRVTAASETAISGNFSYAFTQASPATTWVISHNLSTTQLIADFYGTDDKKIIPDDVEITDANTVTVTFTSAVAGTWYIVVIWWVSPVWPPGPPGPAWLNTAHIDRFVATAAQTVFNLSNTPADPEFVWISSEARGYLKQPDDYSVAGDVVTLAVWATISDIITVQYVEALGSAVNDPTTIAWDMFMRNSSNVIARLPIGNPYQVLQANAAWDEPSYGVFLKRWVTAAMAWTSIVHVDSDATANSNIIWTAANTTVWNITVTLASWTITFTSTAAETVAFNYTLIK